MIRLSVMLWMVWREDAVADRSRKESTCADESAERANTGELWPSMATLPVAPLLEPDEVELVGLDFANDDGDVLDLPNALDVAVHVGQSAADATARPLLASVEPFVPAVCDLASEDAELIAAHTLVATANADENSDLLVAGHEAVPAANRHLALVESIEGYFSPQNFGVDAGCDVAGAAA